MEDQDMDPELAIALAMSMQEDSPPSKQINSNADSKITVDLTNESPKATNTAPVKPAMSKLSQSTVQWQPNSFVLDRKQMEAERLARLNARIGGLKRSADEGVTSGGSRSAVQNVTASDESDIPALKRRRLISPPAVRKRPKAPVEVVVDDDLDEIKAVEAPLPNKKARTELKTASNSEVVDLSSPPQSPARPLLSGSNLIPSSQTSAASSQADGIQYPYGTVKRTWAFGHDRQNDIKIEEVLQKNTLTTAVLSSFQWDWEWVESKLNRPKTKVIMIMQAKDEAFKNQMREETKGERGLQLCFPPMPGQVNCMHSKLMLLFHPTHLRVVVPSANLVPYDWGESRPAGMMENSVFLIDLPRKSGDKQTEDDLTSFKKELLYFLRKKGIEERVMEGVLDFDFAHASFEFVHTVGGTHFGEDALRTGYVGLNKAVRNLGLRTDDSLNVDFVTSSIGSLNNEFLSNIYRAAQGEKLAKNGKDGTMKLKNRFRVFFPTQETVEASTGGPDNAGTVCLHKKWWDASTFPRQLFHNHQSIRPGLLSHSKIIFARGLGKNDKPGRPIAWAYVGSANLSESAWGKMVMDRARKEPKLNCRNWECGVLIPVPDGKIAVDQPVNVDERDPGDLDEVDEEEKKVATLPTMGVFSGIVDVPMEWPSEVIGDRKPWFFME